MKAKMKMKKSFQKRKQINDSLQFLCLIVFCYFIEWQSFKLSIRKKKCLVPNKIEKEKLIENRIEWQKRKYCNVKRITQV